MRRARGTARPRRRARWAVAAAVAPVAWPALAGAAPVIATDAVCLRPAQQPDGSLVSPPLVVRGAGFSPDAAVAVGRGARPESAVADPTGSFTSPLSVLDRLRDRVPRSRPLDVVATDPALGTSNRLRVRTAALAFSASPRRATPSSVVTFRFSGLEPGRPVYAHYRFGPRVRANVAMGRASEPCGLLTARRRQIPVRDPDVGLWRIQFDHRRSFSARATPRLTATVDVLRTSRGRR
ncbi:MAG TPA: hypothetical protein VHK23_02065 [Miltoncostaeaceae bacterium]|nr:hypothetical protein [Miltoncostaeaceae bacterium]